MNGTPGVTSELILYAFVAMGVVALLILGVQWVRGTLSWSLPCPVCNGNGSRARPWACALCRLEGGR